MVTYKIKIIKREKNIEIVTEGGGGAPLPLPLPNIIPK